MFYLFWDSEKYKKGKNTFITTVSKYGHITEIKTYKIVKDKKCSEYLPASESLQLESCFVVIANEPVYAVFQDKTREDRIVLVFRNDS